MTNKILQFVWERLTEAMIRRGFGAIWMQYHINYTVRKICQDPEAAKRAGFEVTNGPREGGA